MAAKTSEAAAPITIKKYANRRLYNTETSSYVTLDDLCQMVKDNKEFVVYDAKTGEDITRSVLTQIIVEEEGKGQNLLPISFLRQLIGFYGDSLGNMLPRYLESSMKAFAQNQEKFRQYMKGAFDGFFPFGPLEEMGKQNVAMMERAMKMFTPFGGEGPTGGAGGESGGSKPAEEASRDTLNELKEKIDALQRQLNELGKSSKGEG
ncbi:MAG TPA: polyhydroxyalkanoate synthesis repressor PhaR [Alphaproteobacteria bacterium]|nr:polyhydroxyalkanoate synthesis repressor PhaR [Alphaproteobacteria bacterium]